MTRRSGALVAGLLLVVACDCSGGQVGTVEGGLSATPQALDFGTQYAGKTKTLSTSLFNKGGQDLQLGPVSIEGDGRGAFVVASAPPTIAGRGNAEISVTYTAPATDGDDVATLVVAATGLEPVRVALTAKSTTVCPGGKVESSCSNGEDEDCDGKVDCDDSDCAAACSHDACLPGTELKVTGEALARGGPAISWNGSEFTMLWLDQHGGAGTGMDYGFARAASATGLLGGVTHVTPQSATHGPSALAWGDGEAGLAWSDIRSAHNDIYFERVSANGLVVAGSEVRLTETDRVDFAGTAEWNPVEKEWLVAYSSAPEGEGSQRIIFTRRLSSTGLPLAEAVEIGRATTGADYPFLAWNGDGYGAIWFHVDSVDEGHVRFQRLDGHGAAVGTPLDLGAGFPGQIAWSGSELGVVWSGSDGTNSLVQFQRIGADGAAIGAVKTLASMKTGSWPRLAHGPAGWVVTWAEAGENGASEARAQKVSDEGAALGTAVRITCSGKSSQPVIAYGNGEFGVAWLDMRDDATGQIYFKILPKE